MNLKRRRRVSYDMLIVVIIIVSSFMVYAHVLCPVDDNWVTSLFSFTTSYYSTVEMYCFQVLLFLCNTIFLSIWYITCRYWWKSSVFILLVVGLYKLFVVVFSEVQLSDIVNKIVVLFLTILVSYAVYLISKKVNYPLWNRLNLDAIDSEEILKYKFKNTNHYSRVLNSFNEEAYVSNVDDLKQLVAKAVLMSEDESKEEEDKDTFFKNPLKRRTLGGYLMFFLIISIVFIARIYKLTPRDATTWNLGFMEIGSFEFQSVRIFFWFTLIKVTSFIILTIWFLSSRYWWKYFLLIPLTIVSYQIIAVFNVNEKFVHENEVWQAFPVLIPLMLFLVFLSFKLNNFTKVEKLKNKIKAETFKVISFLAKDEESYSEDKLALAALIADKDSYEPTEYLKKLEELNDKLKAKKSIQ